MDSMRVQRSEYEALRNVAEAAPRNLLCRTIPDKSVIANDDEWPQCGECVPCRFNAALAALNEVSKGE